MRGSGSARCSRERRGGGYSQCGGRCTQFLTRRVIDTLRFGLGALLERRGDARGAEAQYGGALRAAPGHSEARAALQALREREPGGGTRSSSRRVRPSTWR